MFRRLAVDYLPYEDRIDLGILTTGERLQPTLPGVDEMVTPSSSIVETRFDDGDEAGRRAHQHSGARPTTTPQALDAPYCYECGVQMQRAGSCFACPSCGTTSGCS
jgi:ribonucleoside-diphosphate reductase alpha chain